MFFYYQSLLERYQIYIYFTAVFCALFLSIFVPEMSVFEVAINPAIGFMLFVTFLQIPLGKILNCLMHFRFLCALIIANFIAIPCLVWFLLLYIDLNTMVQLGVFMVLLTPCVDYVVTFCHMGKADAALLVTFTPFLLLAQMLLLPLYLRLFFDASVIQSLSFEPFMHAFGFLILLPLILAGLCQFWGKKCDIGKKIKFFFGILNVPATAIVLFIVIAALSSQIGKALDAVQAVIPLYVSYAFLAPFVGFLIGYALRLRPPERRAIAFSSATRNSLVVLPLVLAIPDAIPILPAIIISQTLIELVSELFYVHIIAKL